MDDDLLWIPRCRPGPSPQEAALLHEASTTAHRAAAAADPVSAALEAAQTWASAFPLPAHGDTALLWSALARIGAVDLTVARAAEPHLDAAAILAQAGEAMAGGSYGVFAAEQPGLQLAATEAATGWQLSGTKPWCSLADRVERALVTARTDDGRRLFDVGMTRARVDAAEYWVPHGLRAITTSAVHFDSTPAQPVGAAGWYLQRPGFAWGGVGVAAIWFGAAVAIARTAFAHFRKRAPDQIASLHAGQLDLSLRAARAALASAAASADTAPVGTALDDPAHDDTARDNTAPSASEPSEVAALRARCTVAATVDEVIRIADHAMGPAPLSSDAAHIARISDLRLYVRQHHAERDVAALGEHLIAANPDAGARS